MKFSQTNIVQSFFLLSLILLSIHSCSKDRQVAPQYKNLVSAATPEAMAAGDLILKKGGNAADAAIATAFALAVSEPAMAGLGGGIQIMINGEGGAPVVLNGSSYSPMSMPKITSRDQIRGHTKTTIPSFVKALDYLHKNYGSGKLPWADLLTPAIKLAEKGFQVGEFRQKVYAKYESHLLKSPSAGKLYLINDRAPSKSDTIRFPVLAQTLKRIASVGAQDFYTGQISEKIAIDMQVQGGWITADDLRKFPTPDERDALHYKYHGYDVYTMPPPGGGWVLIKMLQYLDELTKNDMSEIEWDWVLIQAIMLGHQQRAEHGLHDLDNYQDALRERFQTTQIQKDLVQLSNEYPSEEDSTGETTHFSVMDNSGMALSITTSINAYFGARVLSPELGFLYNSYMDDFELDTLHPHRFRPQAMAYSSMTPTIVKKDGEIILVLGSPGSKRIISAVCQIIHYVVDRKIPPEEAVQHFRIHAQQGKVYFESNDISSEILDRMEEYGFALANPSSDLAMRNHNAYFGGVHAIAREGNRFINIEDIRRDGYGGGNSNVRNSKEGVK